MMAAMVAAMIDAIMAATVNLTLLILKFPLCSITNAFTEMHDQVKRVSLQTHE